MWPGMPGNRFPKKGSLRAEDTCVGMRVDRPCVLLACERHMCVGKEAKRLVFAHVQMRTMCMQAHGMSLDCPQGEPPASGLGFLWRVGLINGPVLPRIPYGCCDSTPLPLTVSPWVSRGPYPTLVCHVVTGHCVKTGWRLVLFT